MGKILDRNIAKEKVAQHNRRHEGQNSSLL